MPPPPQPSISGRISVVPPSPFVLAEANPGLFTAVLYNWTRQACSDCRMVLAAPGVYPINEVRECVMDGENGVCMNVEPPFSWHCTNMETPIRSIGRNKQEIHLLQGGRRLVLEASVEGVIIQPLTVVSVLAGTLVLRRLTFDVRSFSCRKL